MKSKLSKTRVKAMQQNSVNPPAIFIIGTNGTGKTTDAINAAKDAKHCLFFTSQFPQDISKKAYENWVKKGGIYFVNPGKDIQKSEALLGHMLQLHKNLLIIIDDLRLWIGGSFRVSYTITRIMAQRRHNGHSLIFCVHSLSQIPFELLDYEPQFYVKYTTSFPSDAFMARFPSKLIETMYFVNDQVKRTQNRFYGCPCTPFKS